MCLTTWFTLLLQLETKMGNIFQKAHTNAVSTHGSTWIYSRYRKVWKGHGGTSGEAFNMIFTLSVNTHPLSTVKFNTLLKY